MIYMKHTLHRYLISFSFLFICSITNRRILPSHQLFAPFTRWRHCKQQHGVCQTAFHHPDGCFPEKIKLTKITNFSSLIQKVSVFFQPIQNFHQPSFGFVAHPQSHEQGFPIVKPPGPLVHLVHLAQISRDLFVGLRFDLLPYQALSNQQPDPLGYGHMTHDDGPGQFCSSILLLQRLVFDSSFGTTPYIPII